MDFDPTIHRRRPPGILVFDSNGELVFLNKEAGELLKASPEEIKAALPREILSFSGRRSKSAPMTASFVLNGELLMTRTVPLHRASLNRGDSSHLMVIVERQRRRGRVDMSRFRESFRLTEREAQVVAELIKGGANQDIASALSLSEHTVKDHVKRIMAKLGVKSRSMVICRVFEFSNSPGI
ncbi:MAG: hypothetical protein HYV24_03510 [Deltaproteobacteria bacterium]|nr:hypothetical protein [Deltaproteobacteria bacterium]